MSGMSIDFLARICYTGWSVRQAPKGVLILVSHLVSLIGSEIR